MPLTIDEAMLAEARRFNRLLARLPRFGMRHRFAPILIQGLLRLSQIGADRKLRRAGLRVERVLAQADGLQVPLRVIHPAGSPKGVVFDIHGGGWVIGNARMNDAFNAEFASRCQTIVVSVDYRLATSASLDNMMDDCLAAARWLLQDGPAGAAGLPVIVVGESAGAHLAAATLLRLKVWPELLARVSGAVLYYGVFDLAGSASVRAAGPQTLLLDGPRMLPGLRMLTPGMNDDERRQAPRSPLFGDLAGMPPALMFVGDLDPLLDDTLAMARAWKQVADIELHVVPHAPHGFIHFPTALATMTRVHAQSWVSEHLMSAQVKRAGSHDSFVDKGSEFWQ